MLIYVFAELYPSPFKPYHDVQFAQLCEAGHTLRIFAFGRLRGELHPSAQRLGLVERTRTLPAVLRRLPAAAPALATAMLARPASALHVARAVSAGAQGGKDAVMRIASALCLPETPPDLCLVHNLLALVRLRFLKALYPGVPLALYYHGGELPGVPVPDPIAVSAAFATADLVFTNTDSSRRNAIERGCEAGKIVVSQVGFDLREFPLQRPRRYRRDGLLHVLCVGRLSEEKGFVFALRALQDLRARGLSQIRYRIVGDGPEAPRLQRHVLEQGLGDIVELVGWLPSKALHRAYLDADVLLLPSVKLGNWEENQACVAQEAMLAEALVATSRTGGVPESIAPGMSRFSFEPGDAAAIARVLEDLCGVDEASMAALGGDARRWVTERYDIAVLNRQLLDAVRERAAPRPGAAATPRGLAGGAR